MKNNVVRPARMQMQPARAQSGRTGMASRARVGAGRLEGRLASRPTARRSADVYKENHLAYKMARTSLAARAGPSSPARLLGASPPNRKRRLSRPFAQPAGIVFCLSGGADLTRAEIEIAIEIAIAAQMAPGRRSSAPLQGRAEPACGQPPRKTLKTIQMTGRTKPQQCALPAPKWSHQTSQHVLAAPRSIYLSLSGLLTSVRPSNGNVAPADSLYLGGPFGGRRGRLGHYQRRTSARSWQAGSARAACSGDDMRRRPHSHSERRRASCRLRPADATAGRRETATTTTRMRASRRRNNFLARNAAPGRTGLRRLAGLQPRVA